MVHLAMVHEHQRAVVHTEAEAQDTDLQPDKIAPVAHRGQRWAMASGADMQDTCLQPDKLAFVARRGRRTHVVVRQWPAWSGNATHNS